ncbi:MAG: hypothetical protein IIT63_06030, partial [Prevotella sp.]|nr:hypothetical protein [Prevotella sp.]
MVHRVGQHRGVVLGLDAFVHGAVVGNAEGIIGSKGVETWHMLEAVEIIANQSIANHIALG